MPYKNPEDAKRRHQRWYQEHRTEILARRKLWPSERSPHKPRTQADKETQRQVRIEKRAFIRLVKESNPCQDCENFFIPEVMEFDHVRGAKSFELSNCASLGWARIIRELKKCDLVCANDHRIRTYNRRTSLSLKHLRPLSK